MVSPERELHELSTEAWRPTVSFLVMVEGGGACRLCVCVSRRARADAATTWAGERVGGCLRRGA